MVKISIIIPVYNAEKYLKQCLDSILSQSLAEMEIICIDDGSTDGSLNIIEEYAISHNNFTFYHQENRGAGAARNLGIDCAKGKYVMFMDADDYYPDSTVLEKLYEAVEREKVQVCSGNIVTHEGKRLPTCWFDEETTKSYQDFQEMYYFYKYLYNTKMLKDNQIKFPEYRRFEDPPFLVKAMICAEKFYAIEDIVYVYRCGYKEIEYSRDVIIDILRGMKDICLTVKAKGMEELYNKIIRHMTINCRNEIYKYIYNRDKYIMQLVDDIISATSSEKAKKCFSINIVDNYTLDCQKEMKEILEQVNKYKQVIIYGAGKIGKFTLKYLRDNNADIMGVAVSKVTDTDYIENFEVKEITEYLPYKAQALVVIGTGEKYQKEIRQLLSELEFEHVVQYDYKKIIYAEAIKMNGEY